MKLIDLKTIEKVFTIEETLYTVQLTDEELEELIELARYSGSRSLYESLMEVANAT